MRLSNAPGQGGTGNQTGSYNLIGYIIPGQKTANDPSMGGSNAANAPQNSFVPSAPPVTGGFTTPGTVTTGLRELVTNPVNSPLGTLGTTGYIYLIPIAIAIIAIVVILALGGRSKA